jgi:bifunctional DNase/RNase
MFGKRVWLSLVLCACGGAAVRPPPPAPIANVASKSTTPSESEAMPDGYVAVTVDDVITLHGENVVLLLDDVGKRLLPIVIGGTEGVSIQLRLSQASPPRPLTHDLLDSVVRRMGGVLIKAQVDELRDGVFIGSVFVRDDDRIFKLDARPSDAIALAIGAHLPIYVATAVLDEAGVRRHELPTQPSQAPPP